jgi:hypothetical protein
MPHLAGALGRPVWIALHHTREWRWQRQRSETVWYSTARLFRQETPGDWEGVFSRMAAELAQLLQAGASSGGRDLSRGLQPQQVPHPESL